MAIMMQELPVKSDEIDRLARRVLGNLVSGICKMRDAPMSAETHFDSAINDLAKATSWRPEDDELRAVVECAIEHMQHYQNAFR